MNFAEVKRQILNLGFETDETYNEEPTILTDALNLAMRQITNIFPIIREYKIAQSPIKNLLLPAIGSVNARHYDGVNPISYHAGGAKSLYFEHSGTGTLTIEDDNGTRIAELAGGGGYREYREFVSGGVTLTFSGAFSYDIRNIAVYGELYSQNISDIPACKKYIRYDFKKLTAVNDVPVFIDFLEKAEESVTDGKDVYVKLRDFQTEKRHILILDALKKIEYTIFYSRDFIPFTGDTKDDFEVELDYDKQFLLPLLAAWYVWADDEPAKAAKWKNDYEDGIARLSSETAPDTAEEEFTNSLGW